MRTSDRIHIAALRRLLDDNLLTPKEYETIMKRICAATIKEKEDKNNG